MTRPAMIETLAAIDGVEGWLRLEQAQRLWEASSRLGERSRIVEIGSYRGRSTIVLTQAAPLDAEVIAVDPHAGTDRMPGCWEDSGSEGDADYAQLMKNLRDAGVEHGVRHLRMPSHAALEIVAGMVDLVYIDGAHRYRAALADIDGWGARVHHGGTMLVHDTFNAVGVTVAIARRMLLSREWRYAGRTQSLAEYRREPLRGRIRIVNALRQIASLPWFLRNVAIKALLRARLRPLTRLLGYRGDGCY